MDMIHKPEWHQQRNATHVTYAYIRSLRSYTVFIFTCYIRCAALEKHSSNRVQIARCLLDIIRLTFRIRMFLLRHALKLLKICTTRTHNIIVCYVGSYTHSRYQLTR